MHWSIKMHKDGSPEETTVWRVQLLQQNPLKGNRVIMSLKAPLSPIN